MEAIKKFSFQRTKEGDPINRAEMIEQVLNSPIAKAHGVEMVKEMIDRHGDDFLKAMYQSLCDSEEQLLFS